MRQKIHFFCLDLPQSDACFVKAYPRETTEAFLDGHVSSFAFFGGVPLSLLYDNLKIAVAKIRGDGKRERTQAFTELVSHYLFADRFGRPGKGNDKGKVEGLVKFSRANFMVPIPVAASYDDLNAMLATRCRARQGERAGQDARTIGERLVADTAALRAAPLEPCEKRAGRVSSTALVRYRYNDYSVPTRYGFQHVIVKGFVDEVAILCGGKEIARHARSYADGAFVADPLRYLALIEIKPNALDQVAALQGWDLPEVFQHLRHLLEARMGNRGKREFIQVLRLMEAMPRNIVTFAVTEAIHLGAIGFDAVKLIALARIEWRPARLDLAAYPHLPRLTVKTTRALGNSGTGKTHVALALGLAACQKGFTVAFTTAAALVSQLLEARDERRLLKLQRDLAAVKLLIIDELGYVPLSPTGAELLFETFSQRYERGSTIVTSNLPFDDWTQVLGSERLTGALLDRLTHHVSILTMNGDSYRLRESAGRRRADSKAAQN